MIRNCNGGGRIYETADPTPWVYDEAQRLALEWSPQSVGRVVHQRDTDEFWLLLAYPDMARLPDGAVS